VTISKGSAYGSPGPLPADGVVVGSDADAAAVVTEALRAGRRVPPLGLVGGDLCRTLGGQGEEARLRSEDATSFPVDLGCALLDGRLHWFVAHVVAHRWAWRGRFAVAMNAEWLGDLDLGPRSHPGDGLLDLTEGELGLRERLAARRRARTGSHLPHPGLRTTRSKRAQWSFADGIPVALDGVTVGTVREIVLHVEPDALTVVV
jgi:hypothetical protein